MSVLQRARCYETPDEAATALAEHVARLLTAALDIRGQASLVVSGGNTPVPFFHALRKQELAWEKVTITLADERWVAPDDDASNEGLVRAHLLQDNAAAASFVPLVNDADDPISGEVAAHEAVAAMPRPFDVVVLGTGGDGHTASLFPGAAELARALDDTDPALVRGIYGSKEPRARITLTRRALLDSEWIGIHVTGDDKWQALTRADEARDEQAMPVSAVLHQSEVPVDVYWAP
jgi:6-phosphogluconolactonase